MLKYIVGAVAIIAVLGGAYYVLLMPKSGAPAQETVTPAAQTGAMATSTYATSTYSIVYPADYTKDEMYAYDQFGPEKLIHGVKFTVPEMMATGTTLAADSYVAVEQLPRAKNCTADIYIKQDVKAVAFTEDGIGYSVATTSEAAAGSVYEEMVYALSGSSPVGSSPCTAVRYMIHSTNIASYEPGTVQEFNRDQLLSAFDTIRRSLHLNQTMPSSDSAMQP